MSGHTNWKKLRDPIENDPSRAERVKSYTREIEAELTLAEIRKARALTQKQLAASLGLTQPGVSQIESRTDLYLSTLRSYVNALGGELELSAVFPDGVVAIRSIEQLEETRQPA